MSQIYLTGLKFSLFPTRLHPVLSYLKTRNSFQKNKSYVTNKRNRNSTETLYEKVQRTGKFNDDPAENVRRPSAEVTDAIAEVRHVEIQAGIRRMSAHRIMRPNFPLCFVLLPLLHARYSGTLYCSSWMLAKSMVKFDSPIMCTFFWTASQIRKTGAFRESSCCCTIITVSPKFHV